MLMERGIVGILLGAVVVLACTEAKVPTRPETSVSLSEAAQETSVSLWTIDHDFDRVAKEEVPGFAGMYFDANHNPVVLLVDTTQRGAAERYVADFQSGRGESPGPVAIRQADYDFTQQAENRGR